MLTVTELACGHRLQPLSFAVQSGQIVGLAGSNAAGKSTLLQLLAGQLTPSAGHFTWQATTQHFTQDASLKHWAQQRAWLAQSQAEMPGFSVADVVTLGAYPFGAVDLTESKDAIFKAFALESLAHRDMATLSGGQQQRVHLARLALQLSLPEPGSRLVLLDEPLTGLDLQYQQQFLKWLRQQTQMQGWAVILVLHELSALFQHVDYLLLLKQGQCVQQGTLTELFPAVSHQFVANPMLSQIYNGADIQLARDAERGWLVSY